jgi:hypothetical protein
MCGEINYTTERKMVSEHKKKMACVIYGMFWTPTMFIIKHV